MFNVGGGELLVILLIALIVLGPKRLPDAARQIGKTMGDLRRLSTGFQDEMRAALDSADDPTRTSSRRNPLADEPIAVDRAASDAIAAVSEQGAPPSPEPDPHLDHP
jgi:sec-independent protein translocase protein TatB